jgi:hypothetical protein
METREDKQKICEEYYFQIQASADNLALATSPEDSIVILRRVIENQEDRKQIEASNDFQTAITYGGTTHIECDGCNRVHFSTWTDEGYSEGVLEELRAKRKQFPGKYVEHADESSISHGYIGGKEVVVNCDCGEVRKFERFFWNHRDMILEFFKQRAFRSKQKSDDDNRIYEGVKESLKDA